MSVHIKLDRPHSHFTNLDLVTGRVILNLTSNENITTITVKLEGESRTRLAVPRHLSPERQRDMTELENHKLLYQVVKVFPGPGVQHLAAQTGSFTLKAGQYEYPFKFKLPFNNNCSPSNSLYSNLNILGPKIEIARDSNRHVKNTLPPSLGGFPGEAEIKYFVKATVNRAQFYKENRRSFAPIKFLPIEPPRPPFTGEESYARRAHQFRPLTPGMFPPTRKKSMFDGLTSGSKRSSSSSTPASPSFNGSAEPPRFSVDARLPNPAAITCNEPIPLRILIHKQSACPDTPIIQLLQIELIGYTSIRAHELHRVESGSWVIMSNSNMALPIGNGSEPNGAEVIVDDHLWKHLPLPNTVAPTFETCNIKRHYELEVRVGLSYGAPGRISPELIVLPLRLPVHVYSGIKPPPALLEAMQKAQLNPNNPVPPAFDTPSSPPPVVGATSLSAGDAGGDLPDVAPPSYEDAMAEDIGPVDGRRRDYQDGETRTRRSNESADGIAGATGDVKAGGLRREGTLRLEGEVRRGSGGTGAGGTGQR